jgi:hypothetical protein
MSIHSIVSADIRQLLASKLLFFLATRCRRETARTRGNPWPASASLSTPVLRPMKTLIRRVSLLVFLALAYVIYIGRVRYFPPVRPGMTFILSGKGSLAAVVPLNRRIYPALGLGNICVCSWNTCVYFYMHILVQPRGVFFGRVTTSPCLVAWVPLLFLGMLFIYRTYLGALEPLVKLCTVFTGSLRSEPRSIISKVLEITRVSRLFG